MGDTVAGILGVFFFNFIHYVIWQMGLTQKAPRLDHSFSLAVVLPALAGGLELSILRCSVSVWSRHFALGVGLTLSKTPRLQGHLVMSVCSRQHKLLEAVERKMW